MSRDWVVAISYGELILKGKNRQRFVEKARRQIDKVTEGFAIGRKFMQQGKYYLSVSEEELEPVCRAVQKVFGLVYVTPAIRVKKDLAAIREAAVWLMNRKLRALKEAAPEKQSVRFKVRGKRSDKSFPLDSPQLSAQIGAALLAEYPQLTVDVHHPELTLYVDVRDDCFLYIDRLPGMGGLPMGSGGRGLVLLSGGIDSPVAGFQMARRGVELGCVHFHSYPFTSERAQQKALQLAEQMSRYVGPMAVYMVNLLEIYTAIHQNCKPRNTTILSRRMMMRIADALCAQYEYDAMITGESLGQVASQTIQGISVVNDAATRPILRPLIATDKNDIIEIAREIETYEISIEPYDDCCSVFAPDRPNTKPRLSDILLEETHLEVDELVARALAGVERVLVGE